jgi:hypothetical protein
VSFDCWASNPDIQAFMKQAGYGSNYSLLEGYYETRILDICEQLGLDYVVWYAIGQPHAFDALCAILMRCGQPGKRSLTMA